MLQTDLFKGNSQKTRERDACDPFEELVGIVEAMAVRKCSVNQVVAAVRAFAAQRAAPVATGAVWLSSGSPEWRAWTAYRGRSPPIDKRGGWRFPSRWPPQDDMKPKEQRT
jgi:hypothetical protein